MNPSTHQLGGARFMCHNKRVFGAHLSDKVKEHTARGHNTDIIFISGGADINSTAI